MCTRARAVAAQSRGTHQYHLKRTRVTAKIDMKRANRSEDTAMQSPQTPLKRHLHSPFRQARLVQYTFYVNWNGWAMEQW